MLFSECISGLQIIESQGDMDIGIDNIVYDSRKARHGSLFVCIEGYITDGHKYIEQAADQGVSAMILQREPERLTDGQKNALAQTSWIRVANSRRALAHVSDRFFDHPSARLDLIGITGTKGKTTAAYMVQAILSRAGRQSGLIGTVENRIGDRMVPAARTTPESYDLQSLLHEMTMAGMDSCVMEVSSQGLKLDRVFACRYKIGAFTNLYEDHIGPHEHVDMQEYLASKLLLLERSEISIVNQDIDLFERVRSAAANTCITYGMNAAADVCASNLRKDNRAGRSGTTFDLKSPWFKEEIFVGMPGLFNVSNALAAIAICGSLQIEAEPICAGLAGISVPGRVQNVPTNGKFQVIVDYAHNAASLENLLTTLREYTPGRLLSVFGNGGDRARSRRYEMGEVSGRLADLTIITSDNPRTEDPMAIIADVIQGIEPTGGQFEVVPDRREAIARAIELAGSGDMIVIAGKGHETYQIFKDRTIHFDDAETAAEILAAGGQR